MRAAAALRAEADATGRTRLTLLRSQAPLVLRPTAHAVYLAAAAGGPVGGDELELSVHVGPGARLDLRTVGATVVLPGRGESSLTVRLHVAAGGVLTMLPEQTVVAARARHRTCIDAQVEDGGSLLLRDEVILGRHHEVGGSYRGLVRVDAGVQPLLRHELVLDGADPATMVTAARACGSVLAIGPLWAATGCPPDPARSPDPDVAALALTGRGTLATALAEDALWLRRRLDLWMPLDVSGPARHAA